MSIIYKERIFFFLKNIGIKEKETRHIQQVLN